jgi:hypothetical protein
MSPATTLYEVSTNLSLQFTTSLNRGSIYNGAIYQNFRSGSVNYYNYTGSNLIDASSSISPNVQSFSYDIAYGNQSWSCVVSHDEGPQPLDNKGNNAVAGPLSAGNLIASSARTIEGAYPYFANTVSIETQTKQTLVAMSSNPAPTSLGMALVTESGGSKQAFEIPNARLSLSNLSGIRTYNTVSSQWEYELGSNTLSLTRWTTSSTFENIQGYNIPYTKYTYNGPDRSGVNIRLEF